MLVGKARSATEASRVTRGRAFRSLIAAAAFAGAVAAAPVAEADLLTTFEASSSSTQAGAHADVRTNFVVTDLINDPVKSMRFRLPVGLLGSIGDFTECPLPSFYTYPVMCPPESQVGGGTVLLNVSSQQFPVLQTRPLQAFVLQAGRGDTAVIGVYPGFGPSRPVIHVNVRPDDYGLDATISGLPNVVAATDLTLWGVPWDHWDPTTQAKNKRLPFMSNPGRCGTEDVTTLEVDSYVNPGVWEKYSATTPAQTGCELLEFAPSISMEVDSPFASTPSGMDFTIDVPQNNDPDGLATPAMRNVTTVFPEGVSINPALANGLEACTDAQLGKGSNERSSCPAASKIATAELEVPALKDPKVVGSVYVGEPLPGDMYRLFIEAYGSAVRVKLKGSVTPDPVTGQLTASFKNNPEAQASSIKLSFDGGPRAALAMPDTCGPLKVSAAFDAWSGHSTSAESVFNVSQDPLGSACVAKPFAPSFTAGAQNPVAGASSTFSVRVQKPDGQPDLTGVRLSLPPGLVANLKGNLGRRIGTATASAGVGPSPFALSGPVVLEGPYGDAPFSMRVTVPAVAGPFDLGDVVVRQRVYVDPNDAHVTVVSDPLPTILEGIPIRLQRLDVSVDRPGFMLNPTSCAVKAIGGTLGAANGASAPVSSRFQVGSCGDLKYQPKLAMSVSGELKNGGHPQLSAKLTAKKGEANQKKAQVTLPLNLALDPKNAKALCEPSQVPTNSCPAGSIVGKASAVSILDVPLEGPVYFVRGERRTATGRVVATLPKLFIPLKGQGVTVNLHASSDVVDRKLQTTFGNLPDAPIDSFDLTINGGANGILKVTNGDVCTSTSTPKVGQAFSGQNGKVFRTTSTLGTACRFGIVKTVRSGNRLTVTASGLSAGKVSVSGSGVSKGSRSVQTGTTVASVGVSLNAASKRALAQGRTLRLRVKATFDPSAKGKKTVSKTTTVVVKPATK